MDRRRFKWIEWNLAKIEAHRLSADEVEAAFDQVARLERRRDGSYRNGRPDFRRPLDMGDLAL